MLDGVTNTKSDRGVAFVPSINGTQEFTVQTNSYDAQFGRVGGGVTMITSSPAPTALHGQLFEYLEERKTAGQRLGGQQGRRAEDPVQEQHLRL